MQARPTRGCCGSKAWPSPSPPAPPGPTPRPTCSGQEDEGYGIYRDGERLAGATAGQRPRYYDLTTADGVPYWKIALLHLDSLASTVLQTCAYWGNDDQCAFCGIGLSLAAGRTVAKKRPEDLAEVAVAARDLDGAVDATLTTGSTVGPGQGRALRRPVRGGGQGGLGAAGGGAVRTARRTST